MTKEQVLRWINKQPFRPFRFHTTNGRSFEVRHPEHIALGRTFLFVHDVETGIESDISLLHLTEFERLEPDPVSENA